MNTFIAAMALLSSFIALIIIQYLPSEIDRTRMSFAIGVLYLAIAVVIVCSGMLLTVLEFNS